MFNSRSNENSLAPQFKWLEYTFNISFTVYSPCLSSGLSHSPASGKGGGKRGREVDDSKKSLGLFPHNSFSELSIPVCTSSFSLVLTWVIVKLKRRGGDHGGIVTRRENTMSAKRFSPSVFFLVAEDLIDRQLVRESRADKVMIEHLTTEQELSLNRVFQKREV